VQINAQISALNSQIKAETDSNQRAVAAAVAQLGGHSRDYHDKRITASADVKEAQAEVKATLASLQAAQSKHNRYQRVAKEGALSLDQVEEAQLAVDQQQQALAAAKAKVERALTVINPSNADVTSASAQIAQQQATGKANIAALDKDRAGLIQQRIELQKQQQLDFRDLKQVQLDLGQTTIIATSDGIISQLKLRNPGQTVAAGEQIAQIVPSNVPIVVKAMVTPGDKSKLKAGQNVQMRISACPYPDYGTLQGKVQAISADVITPQANGVSTNDATQNTASVGAFYEVTIQPQSLAVGQSKHQCAIQLGMDGTADIISREESVLQFFLRKARLIADL
jgi:multidrug efflux pump subunit AcrA (membrane-fusion protein)